MKTFFIITFFAAVLLVAKSTDLFASSENCTAKTCSNTVTKCINDKKVQAEIAVPETDPFTILIPGNHF
ncbi:hypothetical protein [Ferruginibacter sp. SUN106]|uniref:hypothetical protein n=1 Tax=Ferruginibacter sp. SUN106 TaxID=2978348 RepID=UPI003D367915